MVLSLIAWESQDQVPSIEAFAWHLPRTLDGDRAQKIPKSATRSTSRCEDALPTEVVSAEGQLNGVYDVGLSGLPSGQDVEVDIRQYVRPDGSGSSPILGSRQDKKS